MIHAAAKREPIVHQTELQHFSVWAELLKHGVILPSAHSLLPQVVSCENDVAVEYGGKAWKISAGCLTKPEVCSGVCLWTDGQLTLKNQSSTIETCRLSGTSQTIPSSLVTQTHFPMALLKYKKIYCIFFIPKKTIMVKKHSKHDHFFKCFISNSSTSSRL